MPYYIEAVENQKSWLKNVAMKPLVILHAMEKYPNMNIVCLDADSEILEFPSLFNSIGQEYDFACHILDWDTWYQNNSHVKEVLSGTVFVRNNEKVKSLLSDWHNKAISSHQWEQKILADLLEERKDIKVYNLPLSYCYIITLPDGSKPLVECIPVIQHYQASRQFKKQIH